MDMLDLSRHSFEKIVESGAITPQIVSGKKYYEVDQLEAFMKTDTYNELLRGVVDPRNTLMILQEKIGCRRRRASFTKKGLAQIVLRLKLKNYIRHPTHSRTLGI